jgi:hypothetical protein
MGLLLREGFPQNRETAGAFAEPAQPDAEGVVIERGNPRLVGLDTGPVDV